MNKQKYEIVKFTNNDLELDITISPDEENIWLSKNQIAELFNRDRSVISKHIKKIFEDLECDAKSNVQKMHIPNSDKLVEFYSLDVVIAVGFKKNSKRVIIFRKWANEVLKELKNLKTEEITNRPKTIDYEMNVVVGQELKMMVSYAKKWDKRDCYSSLQRFLYEDDSPRICTMYGLRRTGKTTILHQAIGEMNDERFNKSAYIKIKKEQSMSMLDRDLKKLTKNGYRYIFIDEITFLNDFVDTASVLSDI